MSVIPMLIKVWRGEARERPDLDSPAPGGHQTRKQVRVPGTEHIRV